MTKIFLILVITAALIWAEGEDDIGFSISAGNTVQSTTAGETVHFKITLVNSSSSGAIYTLKTIPVKSPSGWSTMICQGGVCSPVSEMQTTEVPAGGSLALEFSVITEEAGKGIYRFQVFPQSSPAKTRTYKFTVTAE